MMIKPPLTKLEEKVDSKYTLVTLAAKRAREIIKDSKGDPKAPSNKKKPVSIAMEEIANGDVSYIRTKEGIK